VPGELVGVVVRHSTSRPTAEQTERGSPPDVHLHSHGFLLNMAWVPDAGRAEGGKWRAIDDHNIKKLRQSLEHRTQGEFARLLEDRLGARIDYSTDQGGTTRWRLAGIDPRACELYSTRSREIEAERRSFEQRAGRPLPPLSCATWPGSTAAPRKAPGTTTAHPSGRPTPRGFTRRA
jgi:hypothetical protein